MAAVLGRNGRLLVCGLLGLFLMIHVVLGGVVVDHEVYETGYKLAFRDPEPQWQNVSVWRYWLHHFSSGLHLAVVSIGIVVWLICWCRKEIRHGR